MNVAVCTEFVDVTVETVSVWILQCEQSSCQGGNYSGNSVTVDVTVAAAFVSVDAAVSIVSAWMIQS